MSNVNKVLKNLFLSVPRSSSGHFYDYGDFDHYGDNETPPQLWPSRSRICKSCCMKLGSRTPAPLQSPEIWR